MEDGRRPAITPETPVEEILSACPGAAEVFVRWRLHCVGCEVAPFETLADVCRIYHRPLPALLAELQRRCQQGASGDESDASG